MGKQYNINDKKNYILLRCWTDKKREYKTEQERLFELYNINHAEEIEIAHLLSNNGYLECLNSSFTVDEDSGEEIIIQVEDRFTISELGKNAAIKNLFPSETKAIADELNRLKWTNLRSWIAIVISAIATLVSILALLSESATK